MGDLQRIRGFLEAIRRRVLVRSAVRWGALALAAVVVLTGTLAAVAAALGPASFWFPVTLLVALLCLAVAAVIGVWLPWRSLGTDRNLARLLRRLHPDVPPLGGDLMSAVELGGPAPPPASASAATAATPSADEAPRPAISPALVGAFQGQVAAAVAALNPTTLVPMRPANRSLLVLLASALVLVAGARLFPQVIGRGLSLLVHRPSRFEGAAISTIPIVGEVRLTYDYPAYTGLPPRTVEGSTGDIVAVKGTKVKIETTPLRKSRQALLLLGENGEGGELPTRINKGVVTAHLTLSDSGSYRFWLLPLIGRAVRELRSHRIEAEADRPPRVEIHGPADRLELPTPRPIEVGFAADDDYGLGAVELVFRVDDAPEQRQLLKDGHGSRLVQGRTLWDPARLELSPGSRIAYHLEARDQDAVSGAKVGTSRTLYVVIARPQESVDERLDRQRELLERLTGDLADRLEIPLRAGATPADLEAIYGSYAAVHEAETEHVAQFGRLVDDDRRHGGLGKALRAALSAMADRLGKQLRAETQALGTTRTGSARAAAFTAAAVARLESLRPAHIAELERDVLLLDDLIGRQRLDDLAAVGRELTDAHKRLEDLLARYAATKDEALRRQLEREVRELRSRIGDLAQKIANLKSRNDVPEEWRNLPDTKELAERAKKLDDLLSEGDPSGMSRALSELGKDLRDLRSMLDQNAEGFGAERFPQENRAIADLMKKIGDLEGDQRALAQEGQPLSDKQEAEMEKRLRGQLGEWTKKENQKVERLRQKLSELKTGDPESALAEEVERARESTRQLRRLFAERDLAEAKDEADRATASLDRATEHLDEGSRGRRRGAPEPDAMSEEVAAARALAQEIADDVQQMLPRADETLSPEERARAQAQAERQGSIGDRTEETAREAAKKLGGLSGLERAEEELRGAANQMKQAANRLRKGEAKQASGAQRDAAERLAKLRDAMQDRSMSGAKNQRDPVRIPGADESSAPRAWRQELLDAMKEKAPERFRDDVRRYYEELVR